MKVLFHLLVNQYIFNITNYRFHLWNKTIIRLNHYKNLLFSIFGMFSANQSFNKKPKLVPSYCKQNKCVYQYCCVEWLKHYLNVIRKCCCPFKSGLFYEKPSVSESFLYARWYKESNKVNTCDDRWQFQTELSMMNWVLHMSPIHIFETSTKGTRKFMVVVKIQEHGDRFLLRWNVLRKRKKDAMWWRYERTCSGTLLHKLRRRKVKKNLA
jgi:hypothetical protein